MVIHPIGRRILAAGLAALASAAALAACLSPQPGSLADTAAADATPDSAAPADTAPPLDTAGPADTAAADLGGPPALACTCAEGEVYRFDPCVPTLDLGCGPGCAVAADCADGLECAPCTAASQCDTRDCLAACAVPYGPHAVVPEPLRIAPTAIAPGAEATVTLSGTAFYIGALGHTVRLDDTAVAEFGAFVSAGACQAAVRIPADTTPGPHTLWVSQYSGAEPFALAGVLFVGDAPPACAQPGFPCRDEADCCTAPGLAMACPAGRCTRR